MGEEEWLTATDPAPMLELLRGKISERKLRLFGVACCRRLWEYPFESMDDREEGTAWLHAIRGAVGVGEKLADGRATVEELATVANLGGSGVEILYAFLGCVDQADDLLPSVSENAIWSAGEWTPWPEHGEAAMQAEREAHCALLREIVGNPFRPVALDTAWLPPTVIDLAAAAYEERAVPSGELDPSRLAILADALEEAGCAHRGILEHCRSRGPHPRGCWLVDQLLGRE